MLGFSSIPSNRTRCEIRAIHAMIAVHQHFRFHDRHEAGLLTERGVTRERVRIGLERRQRWNARTDFDHRPPLRETRAEVRVFRQPFAEPIESFRDFLVWETGERLRAAIHFNTGDNPLAFQDLDERRAVRRLLPARRFSNTGSTPAPRSRFSIVEVLSSAARIPLPSATRARAVVSNSRGFMGRRRPRWRERGRFR
jgi:hypothetical protein